MRSERESRAYSAGAAGGHPATAYSRTPALRSDGAFSASGTPLAAGAGAKLAPLPVVAGFATATGWGGGEGFISLCQTQDIKSADSKDEKRREHEAKSLDLNKLLAAALRENGMHAQAEKVENCHVGFRGWRCEPNSHTWASPETTCRCRLCAFEMRSRARRMQKRFEPWFASAKQSGGGARFAVLSEKSCGLYDLAAGIKSIFDAFERLRHRVLWVRRVTGCVAVLEITFNEKEQTWHPHLNVMWEGEYIPQAALLKAWASCTRGGSLTASGKAAGVRVEAVRDLAELFKYVTKLAPIVGNAELVGVFMRATHRVKLVRCYGSFYDLGAEADEEQDGASCPDCGSKKIISMGRVWPEQLYLGKNGEWRYYSEWDSSPENAAESPPGKNAEVSEESFALRYPEPRLFPDLAAD